jgi:hypothetical protein
MKKASLSFVGVGDLHLDSKMQKYMPEDLNQVIINEIRNGPVRHAVRNGIPVVVFYGDICDVPHLSADASTLLCQLFFDFPSLRFVLMTGNHDVEFEGRHSLRFIKALCDNKALPNVKVIDKPTTLFANTSTPLRLLPWPSFDVDKSALNVIHVEVNGAQWDHGKSIESERSTHAWCVAGHLHSKQVCGPKKNIHFCGTLWQTGFGEKPDKYFHEVSWEEGTKPSVRLIPHKQKYVLNNLIVSSKEDLSKIERDPTRLYKVFVKSGANISADDLSEYPNVIKINSFKSRQELEVLLSEDLLLNDTSTAVNSLSVIEALKTYMVRAAVDPKLASSAMKVFERLVTVNSNSLTTEE